MQKDLRKILTGQAAPEGRSHSKFLLVTKLVARGLSPWDIFIYSKQAVPGGRSHLKFIAHKASSTRFIKQKDLYKEVFLF